MALNIFRKKEKTKKEDSSKEKKEEKVLDSKEVKPESKKEKKEDKKRLKGIVEEKIGWRVIKSPHITEKATILAENNQYVFKVFPDVNKIEIKRAIKEIYGVDAEDIRIINVPKKKRVRGRVEGWRKGYKKAIVKIKKGQTIEILPK